MSNFDIFLSSHTTFNTRKSIKSEKVWKKNFFFAVKICVAKKKRIKLVKKIT
jgi:hypothetical protein